MHNARHSSRCGALSGAVLTDADAAFRTEDYFASGDKTTEQKRGKLLAMRLGTLNEFLLSGSEATFGDFIKGKNITVKMFLSELPKKYQFKEIGSQRLTDADEKENLEDYTEDLNTLYFEQYLSNLDKAEALAADGESFEAGGDKKKERKAERERKKAELKKAREEKKKERKRIRDLKKSGGLSAKEARNLKKKNRKDFRGKVGSGLGRKIGKLNKFNPYIVVMRNAFTGLLLINFVNLAYNLGRVKDAGGKRWTKFVRKWEVIGGTEYNLSNNIEKARGKKPFFAKRKSADGVYGVSGVEEVVAMVAQATPFLTLSFAAIKEFKKSKGEPDVPDENPDLPTVPPLDPGTADALTDDDDDGVDGIWDKYKIPIIGAVVVAIIIGIIAATSGGSKK